MRRCLAGICHNGGTAMPFLGVSSRRSQASTAEEPATPSSHDAASAQQHVDSSSSSSSTASSSSERVAVAKAALIDAIMQRDKEIFTLKRQHELSMLRVEQHQGRILKDQEDRGIYYEQNCNVHTFDTISVGLYSQRNTMYHTLMVQRLRELKILLTLGVTGIFWAYLYWRYMLSDEMMYIAEPVVFFGSKAQVINEAKQKKEEDEQRKRFMSEVMKT